MKSLHLFAGIGGAALGFHRAGFEPIAFSEIEPEAIEVLSKHWPNAFQLGDVRGVTKASLPETPSVITGGFPCQDISASNWNAEGLSGPRSSLWFEQVRIIDEIKPKFVVAENSPALRTRGLDRVLGSLSEIGYDAEWHCIPASHCGAPHQRDRTWLLAYPTGQRQPEQGGYIQSINPAPDAFREADRFVDAVQGGALPFVCGGHDGFPRRVDRAAIKALGNTVCPEIAFNIACVIKRELENN